LTGLPRKSFFLRKSESIGQFKTLHNQVLENISLESELKLFTEEEVLKKGLILEDMALGNRMRITATPTKIVNGDLSVGSTGNGVLEKYLSE
jgi:protein-disulfide isomerase